MIEKRPALTFLSHLVLILGVTIVQFKYVEKRVNY